MAFYYIKAEHELGELAVLEGVPVLGLDLETTGLVPQQCRIRLIQLATSKDTFVVDLFRAGEGAMEFLAPILTSPDVVKVLHNAKFDVKQLLHHYKLEMSNLFCTMLASILLAMGRGARHSLAEVVRRYLEEHVDKQLQVSDWSGPLTEDQIQYAGQDAEWVLRLHEVMSPLLDKHKLRKVSALEFRTVVPVAAMELKGIFLDGALLDTVNKQYGRQVNTLESAVLEELQAVGDLPGMNTLNLNSPDQVKQALFARGIELEDTSDHSLRPLAAEYPFIESLLKYRHLTKILATTLRPFKEAILAETGRVHANYHQIASSSGRFACSDPNIQQVPREKTVRTCFKPQTGYLYVIADYSQVELRVAAGLANDRLMLDTYADGGDIHKLTAALTTGKHIDMITTSERQAAKAINFGLIYAMGPRGLQQSAKNSYGVRLSLEQATNFRERFFQGYRGIRQWQRQMEHKVKQQKYVRTRAGRVRAYRDDDIRVTELLNVPVQGTAAEGLKSALCIFWDRVKQAEIDAGIVAIIHDEIIVEVKASQAEKAKLILEDSMVSGISWLVPEVAFEAEANIALSWADK